MPVAPRILTVLLLLEASAGLDNPGSTMVSQAEPLPSSLPPPPSPSLLLLLVDLPPLLDKLLLLLLLWLDDRERRCDNRPSSVGVILSAASHPLLLQAPLPAPGPSPPITWHWLWHVWPPCLASVVS